MKRGEGHPVAELVTLPLYHPDEGILKTPEGYVILAINPYELGRERTACLLAGIGYGYTCSMLAGVEPVASKLLRFSMEGLIEGGRFATWEIPWLEEWMWKMWRVVCEPIALSMPPHDMNRYGPLGMIKWVDDDEWADYPREVLRRYFVNLVGLTPILCKRVGEGRGARPSKLDLIQILGHLPNFLKLTLFAKTPDRSITIYVAPRDKVLEGIVEQFGPEVLEAEIPNIDRHTEMLADRVFHHLKKLKRLVMLGKEWRVHVRREKPPLPPPPP